MRLLSADRPELVSVGDSQERIRKVFGEPEDVSVKKNPEIWKYEQECMELAFYRDKSAGKSLLESVHFYFSGKNITPDEFRQAASVFGIRLKNDPELTFESSQIAFRAESGVSIIFNVNNGDFRLSSMHYYNPTDQIGRPDVSDSDECHNSSELKDSESEMLQVV
ncbi:hypothetical protein QUF80_13260 [Desulfococcaceae bacterium HSG8]|nr:hypothetical protein [Desulfococcaceae bacterium HSG8]